MNTVTMDLNRYDKIRSDLREKDKIIHNLRKELEIQSNFFYNTFGLYATESNQVRLSFNIENCKEILRRKLEDSEYKDTHELDHYMAFTNPTGYTDITHVYFYAKPKEVVNG